MENKRTHMQGPKCSFQTHSLVPVLVICCPVTTYHSLSSEVQK